MTQEYLENHKIFDARVGDRVKIISRCENREYGWEDDWADYMTPHIGECVTILQDNDSFGYYVQCDSMLRFNVPYFCLSIIR